MKNAMLSIAVALTLSAPALAESEFNGEADTSANEVSLTDLLHIEQHWISTLPAHGPDLYWSPDILPSTAPASAASCTLGAVPTTFPVRQSGSYAECVTASFPQVDVVDDVPDQMMPAAMARSGRSTLRCTKGNFTGELEVSWGGRPFVMRAHRYRITKRNGQQGGNKANINMFTRTNQHSGNWEVARSPDKMVQNGQWYNLDLQVTDYRAASYYFSEVEFVFDKSGTDPKCKTGTNWMSP